MNDKHKDAVERFEAYAEADRHNREAALDDLNHISGNQWDDDVRRAREGTGRPVLTVNKLPQFINQVAGDIRQAQPAIEPVPSDANTAQILTDIMSGIIRQVEYQSKAAGVYAWGSQCQIACGIGHWQIVTEYADDTTFDQDIRIKRIMDPLSVVWDSGAVELDRSDAMECFVTELIPEERFERLFKTESLPNDFQPAPESGSFMNWRNTTDKTVRVASHYWKEETKKTIGLAVGGRVVELDGIPEALWQTMGIQRVRKVPAFKIMHAKLSGDGYLEEPKEIAGKHIPIVPVIGNEIVVDGTVIRHGVIRFAKDPQRLYNYYRSAQAELIGVQPRAPYIGTAEMFKGLEGMWSKANSTNFPYLPYNPDTNAPGARPTREAPPQGSPAMSEERQTAENDLYGTTGIYPTSLGQKSNESSGRAILAREKQSDTGSYIYQDNFKNASMVRTGEILLDKIPRVYDTERVIRILGDDGMEKMAQINVVRNDPFHGQVIVNDLSSAKFDVRVKVGSAFASSREQSREMLSELMSGNPALFDKFGDLFFETLDGPVASKLTARAKKTMPAEIVGEGGMQQAPNPVQDKAAMLQLEKLSADVEKIKADTQGKQIDNSHKAFQFGSSVDAPMTHEPAPTGQ